MFEGKWFDEVKVGDRFTTALTVTETHLVLVGGSVRRLQSAARRREPRQGLALRRTHPARPVHVGAGRLTRRDVLPHHRDRVRRAHLPLQGAGASRRHAAHDLDRDRTAAQAQARRAASW